jgi:hypothetical protein
MNGKLCFYEFIEKEDDLIKLKFKCLTCDFESQIFLNYCPLCGNKILGMKCNKNKCYWNENKYSSGCLLSYNSYYICYKSGFQEHYQEENMFSNELGMNEVKRNEN